MEETKAQFQTNVELPQEVMDRITEAAKGEKILFAVLADLTMKAHFGRAFLSATDKAIYSFTEDEAEPLRIEYSEKDDKFRLICAGCRYGRTVNIARILSCRPYRGNSFTDTETEEEPKSFCELTLKIRNERNALERCMLHFAHFEKRAEQIDRMNYLLHIRYEQDDETEMVIRVLSFGPMVEVLSPENFRELIKERLKKQKICGLF